MQESQSPPSPPTPPAPPSPPGTQAIVGTDGSVTIANGGNPADLYQALQAQRRVLREQLESLEDQRQTLAGQLTEDPAVANRKGIEDRIANADKRILEVNQQLANSEREIARVAGIPGAAVEPQPLPNPEAHDETIAIIGTTFTLLVLFPLALAQARRIWRRSAAGVAALPAELMERFTRLEQSVDSVAIEVERISEGQRFVTRLMSETRAPQVESAYQKRD